MEDHNTVKSLRDKLQALMLAGGEDSGFPILREDDAGPRLVGYIGASELEHALGTYRQPSIASFVYRHLVQLSSPMTQMSQSNSTRRYHTSKEGRCRLLSLRPWMRRNLCWAMAEKLIRLISVITWTRCVPHRLQLAIRVANVL